MAEFDHGVKYISSKSGRNLARLARLECRSWRPVESTLQATTERLSDRAFVARGRSDRFAVYFEFFASWNPKALWNVLAKSSLLSERERLPTVCILVVLRKKGYRKQGGRWRLSADGQWTQQLRFREILLWNQRPQSWWEQEPGLMALFPLCRHNLPPHEAVAHAASSIERTEPGPIQRADWLHLLSIFGMMAYPRLNVVELIGREKMKDSVMWKEAVAEGKIELRRADIVKQLKRRFGDVPVELGDSLAEIQDLERLTDLFDFALQCAALSEFRAAMSHTAR